MQRKVFITALAAVVAAVFVTGLASTARAASDKPNVLVIWGDDIGQWLQSFGEFPPRQKPGSFNLDRVMEAVMSGSKQ